MHRVRRSLAPFVSGFVLAACLLCALPPASVQAQTGITASYQAVNWDKEIVLPPNAYRALKPVDLNGDFTVKTQPGALVEGVSFQARSGVQHYHAEGTLFRRCRFGVKRNGSGHFIDSALEDCNFNKDDNWYNFWWSTHWVFDNCVFTKQFVRGDLPPLDYSVHATRCTFYSVRLPPVGFKENPANYMQKGDMGFEKCRFVDCEVPQSFLASTVDCVFDSCRFEAKNRLVWPKETTAIKVHAYYASGGSEPPSFINGPLSVEFEQEPMNAHDSGSTLPHTQSGGRITLTKGRTSDQVVMLGIVPKKASEIVEVVATATPGVSAPAATPNAAATGTLAAPATAAGEIHNVEELFRALPANVEIVARGQPNAAGIEEANTFLAKNYAGRPASLRLTLAAPHALGNDGGYQADGAWQGVLYHGTTVPACAVAVFRAANAAALAKVPPKSEFALRGIVSKAEFTARGNAVSFVLSVGEAQVLDSLAALAAPAAGAGAAAGNDAQMVGTWTFMVIGSGFHGEMIFGTDHSMIYQGRRQGSWATKGNQFVISFDDKSHDDIYDLPAREGVLYGKNSDGTFLQMIRQGAPTSPILEAQVLGSWDFDNHDGEGYHRSYRFNADHTFMEGNELRGHWFLLGHVLMFRWEGHPEWTDNFELPGKDGVLTGVNGFHHPLTLTRKGPAEPPKPVTGTKPGNFYFGSGTAPKVP